MDDAEVPRLCNYCVAIDFERLRNPTAGAVLRLNQGGEIYGEYPFKYDTSTRTFHQWNLGRQQRIDESATSCSLCRAITSVLSSSGIMARHAALFAENPQCSAGFSSGATFQTPEGTSWCLPADMRATRFEKEEVKFFLEHLSLHWNSFQAGSPLGPGYYLPTLKTNYNASDVDGRASLYDCFQLYDVSPTITRITDLFRDELLEPGRMLFGGRDRPPQIDFSLPKRWLEECLTNHGWKCSVSNCERATKVVSLLRLIDVNCQSIVELLNFDLSSVKYVTLSYVWGESQKLLLTVDNIDILTKEHGLDSLCSKTIQDAMVFTSKMGFQYLWVDAVCIIQDDIADKAVQISHMGLVYKHALFTIVAGAGHDAEAGLPGLNAPRTGEQHVVFVKAAMNKKPAIRLVSTVLPMYDTYVNPVDFLYWSTRGWTLQEQVLSRRVLIFTEKQLFWSCRCCKWWEETFLEVNMARCDWFSFKFGPKLDLAVKLPGASYHQEQKAWDQLHGLIRNYGARCFTEQGDVLDGFSDILRECSAYVNEPFLWGLPASARFEQSLCWEATREGLQRRVALTTLPATSLKRKVPFPSWSWLGWKGAVISRLGDDFTDRGLNPQTICYVLRNTPLRVVPVSRLASDNPRNTRALSTLQKLTSRGPLAVTLDKIYNNLPSVTSHRLSDTPDDQLLFFFAETARFALSGPVRDGAIPRNNGVGTVDKQCFEVLDREGAVVGMTAPPPHGTFFEGLPEREMRIEDVEFVAIANSEYVESEQKKIVLQIERIEGVAYRINIAEIKMDVWERATPNMELIVIG